MVPPCREACQVAVVVKAPGQLSGGLGFESWRKSENRFLSFRRDDGPQQLILIPTGLAGRSAGKGTPIDPFEETPSLQSVLKPAGEMAARVM